jgi:hypothetical protein
MDREIARDQVLFLTFTLQAPAAEGDGRVIRDVQEIGAA